MKYENIKAGDIVYIQHTVNRGFRRSANFWLPVAVERITPKQFQVNGNKYKKENGLLVGDRYYSRAPYRCLNLGDSYYQGEPITDETKQYKAYIKALKQMKEINEMSETINKHIDTDCEQLSEIHKKIQEAHKLINEYIEKMEF